VSWNLKEGVSKPLVWRTGITSGYSQG